MMGFFEGAAAAVERLVGGKPSFRTGVAPEADDFGRAGHAFDRARATFPANITTNSTVPTITPKEPRMTSNRSRSPLLMAMKMPGDITSGPMMANRHCTGASLAVASSG